MYDRLIRVVDDFYADPYAVRETALQTEYDAPGALDPKNPTQGGAAWRATCPAHIELEARTKIEAAIGRKITANTFQFRYTLASSAKRAVCHIDGSALTAVVYLTLPEDCAGGTSLFRHLPTGALQFEPRLLKTYEFTNPEHWQETHRIEMKFNRMVVYPGRLFHSPTPPFFGESIKDARLSQTMFIQV